MEIPVERLVLDRALYARFLVGFASSSLGMSSISVNPAFGKSPTAAAGTNQQKLRFVSLHAKANCRHMNTIACGIGVDIFRPIQSPARANIGGAVQFRHRSS